MLLKTNENSEDWSLKEFRRGFLYSPLPIYRSHYPPHNSRKTPIAHPNGRAMAVFGEFEVWPKMNRRSCCTVCNIVLYCTVIYRESRVLQQPPAYMPYLTATGCCSPAMNPTLVAFGFSYLYVYRCIIYCILYIYSSSIIAFHNGQYKRLKSWIINNINIEPTLHEVSS